MAKDMVIASRNALKEDTESGRVLTRFGYSPFIFIAMVIMAVAVLYIWSHNLMTTLEYQVATEINKKDALMEEQKKLLVELATLKSHKRIASLAIGKLQMTYPEREQVFFIEDPGQTK
ncbi:MAG: cell division protein FtsL [Syntrophales bacterium]|jgi:cell division protein FtsL|nr:cell division protein FtsL [Syntrophales bacterium]